jgi:hypothetical protein
MVFSLIAALVGELALPTLVFNGSTNAFQSSTLLLPAVSTIVGKFNAGFAHERLTEPGVYIGGGGTTHCICGRCVNGFLAMCT